MVDCLQYNLGGSNSVNLRRKRETTYFTTRENFWRLSTTFCHKIYIFGFHKLEATLKEYDEMKESESWICRFYDKKQLFAFHFILS